MTLPTTWLLGAAVTFAVQWAITSEYGAAPYDKTVGAVANLLAWPLVLGVTIACFARGVVGR